VSKSFFDKVDSLGIAEDHIQKLRKLEEKEAVAILREYKEIRRELRDRLDTVPEGSFTAQKMRSVLVQVEAALSAQNKSIRSNMRDAAEKASTRGLEDLVREIARFETEFTKNAVAPINLNIAVAASDSANFLFNQYDTSIDAYTEAQRAQIAQGLTKAVIENVPYSEVVSRLSKYNIGEEWKVERLARTELHNIYNVGKLKGMEITQEEALPDLMKALLHPLDTRTGEDSKLLAQLNPIVEIDKPFQYEWNGKTRTFMAPPDRPNDRAILIPYREAWGTKETPSWFLPKKRIRI
jgi:hypothetical protein